MQDLSFSSFLSKIAMQRFRLWGSKSEVLPEIEAPGGVEVIFEAKFGRSLVQSDPYQRLSEDLGRCFYSDESDWPFLVFLWFKVAADVSLFSSGG